MNKKELVSWVEEELKEVSEGYYKKYKNDPTMLGRLKVILPTMILATKLEIMRYEEKKV